MKRGIWEKQKQRQSDQMVEKCLPQTASPLPFSSPLPSPKYGPKIIKVTDTNPS